MEEKDFIKDLFQEKLSNFETPVRPEVWSSISSSIGTNSAATSLSIITKLIIGTSLTASVSAGIWFAVSNYQKESQPNNEPLKKDKESVLEVKEEAKVKETTPPKFSDVQIKTRVYEIILLPSQTESVFEIDDIQSSQNSNNSIPKDKDQISEDKQNLNSLIVPKNDLKSDVQIENVSSNKYSVSKQVPTQSDVKINLPNVFTPNGDGNNDYLTIPKVELTDFSLVILDEKGKTIFTSTDLEFNWDGTMINGDKVPTGDYVYFITAKDSNGKSVTKYSNLSIRY